MAVRMLYIWVLFLFASTQYLYNVLKKSVINKKKFLKLASLLPFHNNPSVGLHRCTNLFYFIGVQCEATYYVMSNKMCLRNNQRVSIIYPL